MTGREGTRQDSGTAGGPRPARTRRGLARAAALVLLAGLGLVLQAPLPAHAVTDGGTRVLVQGFGRGDAVWGAPAGTHWGSPAISGYGGDADVAVSATDGSLWDMRYLNATSSWTTYQVTGPGAVSSDPVIMHAAGDTNIAAARPMGACGSGGRPTGPARGTRSTSAARSRPARPGDHGLGHGDPYRRRGARWQPVVLLGLGRHLHLARRAGRRAGNRVQPVRPGDDGLRRRGPDRRHHP